MNSAIEPSAWIMKTGAGMERRDDVL
jgi:hypothetical protein